MAAIDSLTAENRRRRDPELERELVRVRHAAFSELPRSPTEGVDAMPVPSGASTPGEVDGIPVDGIPVDRIWEVGPGDVDAPTVREAILTAGCVLVRGLVPALEVERLVDGIDRAFAGYDAHAAGASVSETRPWFEPFTPGAGYSVGMKRKWVRDAGGILAADSPRVLYDLLQTFDDAGLRQAITEYLGERPVLSMNKTTLRRVPLDTSTDWHQDGAFLGDGIRTIDVWLSLSSCGVDAPGLDIVPRRLDHLVETGTGDAKFSWSVGAAEVERAAGATPVSRPTFEPGDAVLFDDLFLHRTACDAAMTRERYAIETWFFAPSSYPGAQIPLVF